MVEKEELRERWVTEGNLTRQSVRRIVARGTLLLVTSPPLRLEQIDLGSSSG